MVTHNDNHKLYYICIFIWCFMWLCYSYELYDIYCLVFYMFLYLTYFMTVNNKAWYFVTYILSSIVIVNCILSIFLFDVVNCILFFIVIHDTLRARKKIAKSQYISNLIPPSSQNFSTWIFLDVIFRDLSLPDQCRERNRKKSLSMGFPSRIIFNIFY